MGMTTDGLIVARAAHFGSCLALFGVLAFERLVAVAEPRGSAVGRAGYEARRRWVSALALPVILVSGIAWFVLVAMAMSGEPPDGAMLKVVWEQTLFGAVCHWRLGFWGVTAAGAAGFGFGGARPALRNKLGWFELAGSGFLLGSLAWAGHGLEGPAWHLLADVGHLLAAGVWPAGLLPLALRLRELRGGEEPERGAALAALVQRFSLVSLVSVGALAATGFVNGWILVGSWANLWEQPYGQWLLAKVILFGVAVAIGAVNLLRLSPRLRAAGAPESAKERAAARLRGNVWVELALGMLIVMVVAVLGLMQPAAGAG